VLFASSSSALAKGYESVGVRHAAQHVREARRALQDAQRVLTATKHYEALYGVAVARWVWLSDDVGWPPETWPTLFMVIDRESGGSPKALNASSGAAGLMQFLPQWYHGEWGYPAFDPFIPRKNLTAGRHLWGEEQWQPWSVQ